MNEVIWKICKEFYFLVLILFLLSTWEIAELLNIIFTL